MHDPWADWASINLSIEEHEEEWCTTKTEFPSRCKIKIDTFWIQYYFSLQKLWLDEFSRP